MPAGTRNVLLKVGKLHHRAVCTDLGGDIRLEIQMRSKQGGAFANASDDSGPIPAGYVEVFEIQHNVPSARSVQYEVLCPGGKYRHFLLVYGVNFHGADCVRRLVATNA